MAQVLWEHDCPGHVETELVDGVIRVTCYVEEPPSPPINRVANGLQVLYTFDEGSGTWVHDRSGVGVPFNLMVESEAAVSWIPDGGLAVNSSTIIASLGPPTKVIKSAKTSNEITLEAWVRPADVTQDGPARIVTLSRDFHHRNLQLGQATALYDVRLRTTATTSNGHPSLSAPLGSLTTELTHVVYTRIKTGLARIYINGQVVAERVVGGDLSKWNEKYHLALANEFVGSRPWVGEYHLVAIFDRALSEAEVSQNFQAGPRV